MTTRALNTPGTLLCHVRKLSQPAQLEGFFARITEGWVAGAAQQDDLPLRGLFAARRVIGQKSPGQKLDEMRVGRKSDVAPGSCWRGKREAVLVIEVRVLDMRDFGACGTPTFLSRYENLDS